MRIAFADVRSQVLEEWWHLYGCCRARRSGFLRVHQSAAHCIARKRHEYSEGRGSVAKRLAI